MDTVNFQKDSNELKWSFTPEEIADFEIRAKSFEDWMSANMGWLLQVVETEIKIEPKIEPKVVEKQLEIEEDEDIDEDEEDEDEKDQWSLKETKSPTSEEDIRAKLDAEYEKKLQKELSKMKRQYIAPYSKIKQELETKNALLNDITKENNGVITADRLAEYVKESINVANLEKKAEKSKEREESGIYTKFPELKDDWQFKRALNEFKTYNPETPLEIFTKSYLVDNKPELLVSKKWLNIDIWNNNIQQEVKKVDDFDKKKNDAMAAFKMLGM